MYLLNINSLFFFIRILNKDYIIKDFTLNCMQAERKELKYKKIKIQELEERPQIETEKLS